MIATLPPWRASSSGAGVRPARRRRVSARIGRAVHRALEWIVADPAIDLDEAADAAAREFGAPVRPVRHGVAAIVEHPDGARLLSRPADPLERQRGVDQRCGRGPAHRPPRARRRRRRPGLVGPRLQAQPCARGARRTSRAVAPLPRGDRARPAGRGRSVRLRDRRGQGGRVV